MKVPAYVVGIGNDLTGEVESRVALVVNGYHLANLAWLLGHIMEGTTPDYLNTGDWVGELRWAVEQAHADIAPDMEANTEREAPAPKPLGWGAPATIEAVLRKLAEEERDG